MGKYKKCPRCELNWIPVEEELCEVCKAELGKASKICLLEDDDDIDEEERICPVCKVNYLEPGEDICAACREEQSNSAQSKLDDDDDWQEFVEDDEPIVPDDENEVSLNQLQEDEEEEFEDDEEEQCPDDFDDDLGDIDDYADDDYADDDEEEEDEDDEDDFDDKDCYLFGSPHNQSLLKHKKRKTHFGAFFDCKTGYCDLDGLARKRHSKEYLLFFIWN